MRGAHHHIAATRRSMAIAAIITMRIPIATVIAAMRISIVTMSVIAIVISMAIIAIVISMAIIPVIIVIIIVVIITAISVISIKSKRIIRIRIVTVIIIIIAITIRTNYIASSVGIISRVIASVTLVSITSCPRSIGSACNDHRQSQSRNHRQCFY